MFEVKDKTSYFFIDGRKSQVKLIGDYSELIAFLGKKLRFTNYFGEHEYPYKDWNFSGKDFKFYLTEKRAKEVQSMTPLTEDSYIPNHYFCELMPAPYMIVTNNEKIVDIRNFEEDVLKFQDNEAKNVYIREDTSDCKTGEKLYIRFHWNGTAMYSFKFRQMPVPLVHRRSRYIRGNNHSYLRTMKLSTDTEYGEMIRSKARITPSMSWVIWDNFTPDQKSWKKQRKCRHQWQKNLK